MKIWIDFINSPQVSFFDVLIERLTVERHSFVLTCRDSSNTVALLRNKGFNFHIVGDKAERGTIKKGLVFPRRVAALYKYLKGKKIDVAIGQSSFYLPITAKLLGIPSIYTNDNEHAAGNVPGFLFATEILLPENLDLRKAIRRGASRKKITKYPGIKEGVYLWQKGDEIRKLRREGEASTIYFRPEPLTAQYYSGNTNFLDNVLIKLKEQYPITILSRQKEQIDYFSNSKFDGIKVPVDPMPFNAVASTARLFIGAGGSMTREMAIMGIPTISVYQDKLLDVDKFLLEQNLMVHNPSLTATDVEFMLSKQINSSETATLIDKGRQACELFYSKIICYQR